MNEQIRTLLRAAYIAVLLDSDHRDSFGKGQLHVLEKNLHSSKWPITTNDNEKLKDIVNHWFESNFLTTVKRYIKAENRKKLDIFIKLMCRAAGIPRYKIQIIQNWLFMELWDKADQQMDNIKGNQQK